MLRLVDPVSPVHGPPSAQHENKPGYPFKVGAAGRHIKYGPAIFYPMAYRKGARAERELADMLWRRGAAVVRSAGSGNLYAPDVVAIFRGQIFAFECKAWRKAVLSVPAHQMEKMGEWMRRAGASLYIAWKVPYRGWLFLPPSALERKGSRFSIDVQTAERLSTPLDVILGIQRVL